MTIGEINKEEERLGRKMTQAEMRDFELNQIKEIKKFANHHLYTDSYPYEVVRKVTEITVEVRQMNYVQTKFPKDFQPGGFTGHYADNVEGQDYDYSSDESNPIIRIRFSKSRRCWIDGGRRFIMSDKPWRHYDYNF